MAGEDAVNTLDICHLHHEFLHFGIFLVAAPVVIASSAAMRNGAVKRKDYWKIMLRGCPPWMYQTLKALFIYGIFNFVVFVVMTARHPQVASQNGGMPVEATHGFSGHWMVFYWGAFCVMYSITHVEGSIIPQCPQCQASVSPDDQFCAKCGSPQKPLS